MAILLAEDDPSVRLVMSRYLSRIGEVLTAENGAEALERASDPEVDLIISDHKMPIKTGIELLVDLRARHIKLPFVLYTGGIPSDTDFRTLILNQAVYLMKPIKMDELFATIDLARKISAAESSNYHSGCQEVFTIRDIDGIKWCPIPSGCQYNDNTRCKYG
jgi:DNA-binding response OmpR family regulator